jgi:hypothetical protein
MRQPNIGPLTIRSMNAKDRFPSGSFLNGRKAGCHLLPGVKIGILFLLYRIV